MRTINPAIKGIGLLLPTFFLAVKQNPLLNLGVFLLCLLLMGLSQVKVKTFLLAMFPVALAALGTFFTGYRFQAGSGLPMADSSFNLVDGPIWNGFVLASRVLAYAGLGLLLALTTDRIVFVQSLNQQLKLPALYAYGLLAAWGILPLMVREYRLTKAAFRARGVKVFPVSPLLLKALLIKVVHTAEALAIAMESKGFNGTASRTIYQPVCLRKRDYGFLLLAFLLCGLILFSPLQPTMTR